MKRRNLFIIATITAVVTSLSLHAAFGFSYWRHNNGHYRYHGFDHRCDGYEKDSVPAKSGPEPSPKNSSIQ